MFNSNKINRKNITSAILVILIIYFMFYFLFGRYGFIEHSKIQREITVQSQELEQIETENGKLSNNINSLKSHSLDKDLLDEQVRRNLGYVDKDEIVIYYK